MVKEIKIRLVPDDTHAKLMAAVKKYSYPSLNQFLLQHLEILAANENFDHYQNEFAADLEKIKLGQTEIIDLENKLEIQNIEILARLNTLYKASLDWGVFCVEEKVRVEMERGRYEK